MLRRLTGRRMPRLLLLTLLLLAGCNLNLSPDGAPAVDISGAPLVRIVSPLPNATYLEGVPVNIQALVSNAGADIDRVEVLVDGEIVATLPQPNEDSTASFSLTHGWSATGLGAHTIDVNAFRADGSSSAPATVNITVVSRSAQSAENTQAAGGDADATTPRLPTNTPTMRPQQQQTATTQPTQADQQATSAPASSGSGRPTATFAQGVNVRRGPGLAFEPPIGAFASGQTAEILAVSTAGDWYKVRYGGGEGWVFAALVQASGDTASLPREAGPPPPTAAPTAVPLPAATAVPQTQVNLVAGIVELNPGQPSCAETFNIGFDVANLGTEASSASSTISVQDVRVADGSVQGSTIGGFPVLQPGQTFRVDMPLTVSTWYEEEHRIILIIDPNNQIPETEEGDNRREVTYRLQKGSCP